MGHGELRGRRVRHLRRRAVPGQPAVPGGTYDQSYQADPYQGGQYDPYAYGGQPPTPAYDPTYEQGYDQNQGYDPNYDPAYDPTYDPAQQQNPHGNERPDGSQQ